MKRTFLFLTLVFSSLTQANEQQELSLTPEQQQQLEALTKIAQEIETLKAQFIENYEQLTQSEHLSKLIEESCQNDPSLCICKVKNDLSGNRPRIRFYLSPIQHI